jgi:hypothetical protein
MEVQMSGENVLPLVGKGSSFLRTAEIHKVDLICLCAPIHKERVVAHSRPLTSPSASAFASIFQTAQRTRIRREPTKMKRFLSIAEIPIDCVVAPSAFYSPRPEAEPVGRLDGMIFYSRSNVGELQSREEWKKLGRRVRAGEQPLARRGAPEPFGVYAEWQTSAR